MNINCTTRINKKAVQESFSKAARHYDQFAQLQRDIGEQLLAQLNTNSVNDVFNTNSVNDVLDLGCGTGYFTEKLRKLYPIAEITCFDLSQAMLAQVMNKNLQLIKIQQGDIDDLPFNCHSFDLVFSNLVVQWSEDLCACLQQVKNIMRVGGKLHFSTLLSGSLHELTQAWKNVDSYPHTNVFISKNKLLDQVKSIDFSCLSIKTETRVLSYDSVIDLMRALKGIGANHVHGHQGVKVSGRSLLNKLEQGYQPYINEQGKFTLTYEICYVEVEK